MEKLLVAQALDQRDLLKKKIQSTISKMDYVVVCKEKDTKINGKSIADIEQQIKSDWQSLQDMIDRYNRINRAIILSNAQTEITFSDGTVMTKAEAIALKNKKDNFADNIVYVASRAYEKAVMADSKITSDHDKTKDAYVTSILNGTDKKAVDKEALEVIEKTVAPFAPKWIDPLNIKDKLTEFENKQDKFNSEVETLIKISNATTLIEF